jgi:hypothetical protein
LDSAFRSLDFANDISLCSSFSASGQNGGCENEIPSVDDDGGGVVLCQQQQQQQPLSSSSGDAPSTLGVRVNGKYKYNCNCNPEGNGSDPDSTGDVRGGLPIILSFHDGSYREGFPLLPNVPLKNNERDHGAEGKGSLLPPRPDPPENTTEQDNDNHQSDNNNGHCRLDGFFAEQGHCLFFPGVMLVRKNK